MVDQDFFGIFNTRWIVPRSAREELVPRGCTPNTMMGRDALNKVRVIN